MQALAMKMVLGLIGLTVGQMMPHNVAVVAAAVYKDNYNLMVGKTGKMVGLFAVDILDLATEFAL